MLHIYSMTRATYAQYLLSPHWQTFIKYFRQIKNNKCMRCGGRGWQVHHTPEAYAYIGREYECLDKMELLCHQCHAGQHIKPCPTDAEIVKLLNEI